MKFLILFFNSIIFHSTCSLFWNSISVGITYQLYSRQNPTNGQMIYYSNQNSLMMSNFNNAKPTRILINGYGLYSNSSMYRVLTKSYLKRGDFNVIIVDWRTSSSFFLQSTRNRVYMTGMAVSKFITWLNPNYATLHLIGYDLGAHIAGIAGKNTVQGRINRIVGLDPSLVLFNENNSATRLSTGDAALVEIFHSSDRLGMFARIGNIDYYINNGRQQPDCASSNDITCSHYRSVITFSNLVSRDHNYLIVPCKNIGEIATKCSLNPIEILLEEMSPSGIYQIITVTAEPLNMETEFISTTEP